MSELFDLLMDIFKGIMLISFLIAISVNMVFAVFTSFIAHEKNRDGLVWCILGFFFGFLALLVVGLCHVIPVNNQKQ